jgi:hypothetical protein
MAPNEGAKSLPYNTKKGCKEGYRKRDGYRTFLGTNVPARCVRSTTVYKNTKKRSNIYIPSVKTLARKACPPGMIERREYTRKFSNAIRQKGYTVRKSSGTTYVVHPKSQGSRVKPTCIKDKSKGKNTTKKIGPLRKGELSKFGYSFRTSEEARHKALRQAVDEFGVLGVYRKLDAVAKLSKTSIPEAARIFKADRNWVNSKLGPIKAFENKK